MNRKTSKLCEVRVNDFVNTYLNLFNSSQKKQIIFKLTNYDLLNAIKLLIRLSPVSLNKYAVAMILDCPSSHAGHSLCALEKLYLVRQGWKGYWYPLDPEIEKKNKLIADIQELFFRNSGIEQSLLAKRYQDRSLVELSLEELFTFQSLATKELLSWQKRNQKRRRKSSLVTNNESLIA